MCIALLSTAHPEYPLIVLDNRDAIYTRPTAAASFWPAPNSHVLGGRDLLKAEHGTWLGITRQGRLAVLTNFHEPGSQDDAARSRGSVPSAWLAQPPDSEEGTGAFVERVFGSEGQSGLEKTGGFSLIVGRIRRVDNGLEKLAVVSNRSTDAGDISWIAGERNKTYGLSNSLYTDPWPKTSTGVQLLEAAIEQSAGEREEGLLEKLFGVLDTQEFGDWAAPSREAVFAWTKKTVFVPGINQAQLEGKSDPDAPSYGTTQQTVILVRNDGRVTYVEKTLHSKDPGLSGTTKKFQFQIEEW